MTTTASRPISKYGPIRLDQQQGIAACSCAPSENIVRNLPSEPLADNIRGWSTVYTGIYADMYSLVRAVGRSPERDPVHENLTANLLINDTRLRNVRGRLVTIRRYPGRNL